jgi:hypothetical protein
MDDGRTWIKDGVMSDERDHTIATATVTSEEAPYGVRVNAGGHALRGDEPVDRGGPVTRAVRAGTEIRTTTAAA